MLKVSDIAGRLGLDIRVGGDLHTEVKGCYISDLLSDVMANAGDGDLWITLQTHPNIVAVAVIKGLSGIIITNGRSPEPDTVRKAESENVTILTTVMTTFDTAGLLYNMIK
ncbi:MAG: DRTGG domain-containing protein [Nitrospirae bacterium]|nr:DRTGG domain-containing protein [Nitrospirota bacterium]MCL5977287.1 DRTGG domain-containing protein [Nitrospirota bacterium]